MVAARPLGGDECIRIYDNHCCETNKRHSVYDFRTFHNPNLQVQIPGVAQPISLSLAGATGATANSQTNLQIGE